MGAERRFGASEQVRRRSLRARELSPAQREFAEQHEVIAWRRSTRSPNAVFMYRDEPQRAFRWLVDEDGQVIESEAFRRTGGSRPDDAS
jgi:hypothetical protein